VADLVEAAAVMVSFGVDLVVVGGAALWLHGDQSARLHDLDVAPAPDRANLERLLACCVALGAHARSWPTKRQLEHRELVTVSTSFGPIDLLTQRGREEYHSLRVGATAVPVLEVPVPVASPADVLRLKRRFKEPADV
jgi:hypothetical protein